MIRVKRGVKYNIPILTEGEPGYVTDDREFWVGGAGRNRRVDFPAVYPEEYGAKGDGTTDDTTAIQAAIDSLPSTGGTVLFTAKLYAIATTVHIDKVNVSLIGQAVGSRISGGGTRILWTGVDGGATDGMIYAMGTVGGVSAHNFHIEHIALEGDSKAAVCLKCQSLVSGSYCKSPSGEYLEFRGYKEHGLIIGEDHVTVPNNAGGQGMASFRNLRFAPTVLASISIIVNAQNFEMTCLENVYIDGAIHTNAIYHAAGGLFIRNLVTTRTTTTEYAVVSNSSCLIDGWRSEDKLLFYGGATWRSGPTVLRNVNNRQGYDGDEAYTLATEYPIKFVGSGTPFTLENVYTRGSIYTSGNVPVTAIGVTFDTNIRNGRYQWTASGSGTNEYYLSVVGGGSSGLALEPVYIRSNEVRLVKGTLGSLAVDTWGWGDNDTLGYSTVYIRFADGTDPDTKAVDYIQAYGAAQLAMVNYGQGALFNDTDRGSLQLQGAEPYFSIVESNLSSIGVEQARLGKVTAFVINAITGATPDISGGTHFMLSQSGATNVTDFNGSYNETALGQVIFVTFLDALSTLKFSTGTNLIGNNGEDWTPAAGDGMIAYNTYSAALGWHWACLPIKKSTPNFNHLEVLTDFKLGSGATYLFPVGDHLQTSFNVFCKYLNDGNLYLSGGDQYDHGARLLLYGGTHATAPNAASLQASGGFTVQGNLNTTDVISVDGTQVVGNRRASTPPPSGGTVIDAEARAAITSILLVLEGHGLTGTVRSGAGTIASVSTLTGAGTIT